MTNSSSHLPRHRLTSLLDPRSVLILSDQPLPAERQPQAAPDGVIHSIRVRDGHPVQLDAVMPAGGDDARLDLAVLCVPPVRLVESLGALRVLRPRSVLVLRHAQASGHPADDVAYCRSWGELNDCVVLGPGSFGLQRPARGLNLSLDSYGAPEGRVALVSQSATMMAAVLDWSEDIRLGFSALVSMGHESDVGIPEVLDYLAMDRRSTSIVLYLEQPASSRAFTSALRAAASTKPVVVLKPGRYPARHEPALLQAAGQADAVFDALLRRTGVVRVRYFIQLFSALKMLVHSHRPRGRRIAIVANSRAAAQLALDVMGPAAAVFPAEFTQATVRSLGALLEPGAIVLNPVVTKRPLSVAVMQELVSGLVEDAGVDGVLVLLAPDPYADLEAVADGLAGMADVMRKPVVSCFIGDAGMRHLRDRLDDAGAPAFRTPESAVEGFGLLASYHYSQTLAQQTLPPEPLGRAPRLEQARALLQHVIDDGRTELEMAECLDLFACFHIPVDRVPDGFSELDDERRVPPMAIRVQPDTGLGPAITFGAGGRAEWVPDSSRAVDLPPLNRYLARQLVQRSVLWRRVLSPQFTPAELELVYETLEGVSDLVCELPGVAAIDIDPLYPGEPLLRAGAVRVLLQPDAVAVLPQATAYRHLAIHPYPRRLVLAQQFADGQPWLLRPIRPEDAELLQDFVRNLSQQSRYMRFVSMLSELTPRMLARYTSIDYDRELALVATVTLPNPEHRGFPKETIIGFAHYLRNPDGQGAEYALAIADDWQRRGLGAQLMTALVTEARNQGLRYIDGFILLNNRPMLALMKSLGFRNDPSPDDPGMRRVWLDLQQPDAAAAVQSAAPADR